MHADKRKAEEEAAEKLKFDAAEKVRLEIEDRKNKKAQAIARLAAFKKAIAEKLGHQKKYDRFWADEFIKKITTEQMDSTIEKLNNFEKFEEAFEWFEEFVDVITKSKDKASQDKKALAKQAAEDLKNDAVWSADELQLLTKAILKYPSGMGQRWEMILKFIGGKKSIPAVAKMVTDMKCKNLNSKDQVLRQAEKIAEETAAAEKKKAEEKKAAEVLAPKPADNGVIVEGPKVEWTQEEQNVLQKAMKEFGPKMEPHERWGNIAAAVGNGKTKKDCVTRVKEIKAKLVKK